MKNFTLTIIFIVLISGSIYSQTYDRRYNPNYMQTTLDENFAGSNLDPSVWEPTTHFKRALGFLIDSAITMNVNNGNLELKMQYAPNYLDSIWRTGGWEHVYSNYVGGEVNTLDTYQYGFFECRAKYAHQSGSWPAFWLFGGDGIPCPPGGQGSEIDIAELSCELFPRMMHVIHRYYPPVDCNVSNQQEKNKKDYNISMTDVYSTYKCVWTPDKIEYFINDNLMHEVINQDYEWFPSLPLRLILSQQVTRPYNLLGQEITPITPQTSYFDYVRVKKFFLSPEITCPTIICSSGTSSMDVDPLATNISWALTPSILFSGATTGTGNIANITASPTYHGKGKITYTFNMPSGETFTAEKDVWIKGPDASEVSFDVYKSDGTHVVSPYGYAALCPNTTYHIYVNNSGPCQTSNYTWSVPSAWTTFYTWSNMISINTNSTPGGPIAVNAITCCSNNAQIITSYMGSSYNCGSYYLGFSPNPATNETTLEIIPQDGKTIDENTQWELEVYDQQQSLKEKNSKIKGKQTKINTSAWKDGIYIVRVKIGDEMISEKLVVKH